MNNTNKNDERNYLLVNRSRFHAILVYFTTCKSAVDKSYVDDGSFKTDFDDERTIFAVTRNYRKCVNSKRRRENNFKIV